MDPAFQSSDPGLAREALERFGGVADDALPIADAALALAVPDAAGLSVAAARTHLDLLAAQARREADRMPQASRDLPEARATLLADILHRRHGYAGDRDTYDDPANANLLRVVERRRGLPVALGVLWLHLLRALHWDGDGLDLPGHFLVGIRGADRIVPVDAFAGGRMLDPPALRAVVKGAAGIELGPRALPAMTDRAVLLRLQNNLLVRRLEAGDLAAAYACVGDMLRLAPTAAPLLREAALIARRLGRLHDASRLLSRYLEHAPDEGARRRAAALADEIRQHLH